MSDDPARAAADPRPPVGHRPPSLALAAVGAVALASFALVAYTPVLAPLARRLAPMASPAPADAIVVLGAGAAPDGTLSDHSLRRLVAGLVLLRRGLAARLIVMGPASDGGPTEAVLRSSLAADLGLSPSALIVEGGGRTTRQEAVLAAQRMRELGGRRVLLVTGAHHMPRARRLFEHEGLEVVPAPVVEVSPSSERPDGRLDLAQALVQEAVARAYYRLAGLL